MVKSSLIFVLGKSLIKKKSSVIILLKLCTFCQIIFLSFRLHKSIEHCACCEHECGYIGVVDRSCPLPGSGSIENKNYTIRLISRITVHEINSQYRFRRNYIVHCFFILVEKKS